jgi:hypothetical protein
MLVMTYFVLIALSVMLYESLLALKLGRDAGALLSLLRGSMYVLTSRTRTDEEKESYARRQSVQILKATTRFTAKFVLIACWIYFLYRISTINQPMVRNGIVEQLFSPVTIFILGFIVFGYSRLRRRLFQRRRT